VDQPNPKAKDDDYSKQKTQGHFVAPMKPCDRKNIFMKKLKLI